MLSPHRGLWAASAPASGVQVIDRLIRASPCLWENVLEARADEGGEAAAAQEKELAKVATIATCALASPCHALLVQDRMTLMRTWRAQLACLLLEPRIEQRSDEWYEARNHLVTASDVASAVGGKYGSNKDFLVKKAGSPEEQKPFSGSAPPLKWGIMFEPVANAIYSKRLGVQVHEFGLLRHPHIPHIGASPDGITDTGVMLEIKCPFSRIIDGTVPIAYISQIQCQLDVCGLNECDFFECQFEETLLPSASDDNAVWDGCESGILVEHWDDVSKSHIYDYCPDALVGSNSDVDVKAREAWAAELVGNMTLACAGQAIVRRWKLCCMDIIRVHRDPGYILSMNANLAIAWKRVLRYRGDREAYKTEVIGLNRGPRPVQAYKPEPCPQGYAFLDDN